MRHRCCRVRRALLGIGRGRGFGSATTEEYLHKTYIPTDHFQDSLPTLPIPKLEDSLRKYEYHATPLLTSEKQREAMNEALSAFASSSHVSTLQDRLIGEFKGQYTSYIREPWFDMYLRARDSLLLNWNPALTFVRDERRNDQISRAASLIHASTVFYRTLRDGHLRPDVFETKKHLSQSSWGQRLVRYTPRKFSFYTSAALGAYALDMSQYHNLFHSTRVPRVDKDELVKVDERHRHVVVQQGGAFYTVDVLDESGNALSPESIDAALRDIASRRESDASDENTVGVLTTLPRADWADAREELNVKNASSIAAIDSALFAVCLSDEAPDGDVPAESRCMLHGKATDRWLDKSFQLIVTRDGEAAINFEHSWGDGIAVVRFADEVHQFCERMRYDETTAVANSTDAAPSRRLDWDLTSSTKQAIERATSRAHDAIAQTDYAMLKSDAIDSDWIKSQKLSPDGLLQMVMQLAHYRLKGRPGSTYESAATAAFKHGRTETIRSVTPDSVAMCDAFYGSERSDAEKVSALRKAVETHSKITLDAVKGLGMDRHLFVLRHMALQDANGDENAIPALFRDDSWRILGNIVLSTSTLPSLALKGGGFGPVGPDCFAIGYGVRKQGCQFSVMTAFGGAGDYVDAVEESIGLVKRALVGSDDACSRDNFLKAVG